MLSLATRNPKDFQSATMAPTFLKFILQSCDIPPMAFAEICVEFQ